jgi:hypothetical protein
VWEPNSPIITTVLPGLYHLQLCFFTTNAPTIRVLVNGEAVCVVCETTPVKMRTLRRLKHPAVSEDPLYDVIVC